VAAVDLAGICEVESGDGWEFFCCGGETGEDGCTVASFDLEDLKQWRIGQWTDCISLHLASEVEGSEMSRHGVSAYPLLIKEIQLAHRFKFPLRSPK